MNKFYEVEYCIDGLKPVNTNCRVGIDHVKLVIVCESPSSDEVKKRLPMVSQTGSRVFSNLVRSQMIESDVKYSFDSNYNDFSANGIYLTNLVRYQADLGLKGNTKEKDRKVKELWKLTKDQLFGELRRICAMFPDVKVLFACGHAFKPELKQATSLLNGLDVKWFITSHPSRSSNEFSSNYNPKFWGNAEAVKTKLMKDIELFHSKRS